MTNQITNSQKIFISFLGVLIIVGGVSGLVWYIATSPPIPESEIISEQGIHWHADLSIKILGIIQNNPINVGGGRGPIHTHEANGIIHIEPTGLVVKDDVRLARFFKIWRKKFDKDCIFDKCNGIEGQLKMFVNEEQSFEFENYIMQDKDKIEIIFE